MTRPNTHLVRMGVFLAIVVVIAVLLFPRLERAFFTNAPLNGVILGVLVVGIAYIFRQVVIIFPEVRWIERFRASLPGSLSEENSPRLLGPMATMLTERKGRASLSATSMRTLLDGIASRLDETRDISRYLIGVLIFLGLLGTFWGLLATVNSVGMVIGGLSAGGGNLASAFDDLKLGLEAPLSGMGTAFSSSLFGLAGSLVLGFLDLQASQAQNRFFNDLEEWLSSFTRLSGGGLSGDGDQPVPAYIQALLEQTADGLENLQSTLARGEEGRLQANTNLMALTERLTTLTDQMRTEQSLMVKLAENQRELTPILQRLAEAQTDDQGMDDATRSHIRNIDIYLARLVEEVSTGRIETVRDVRSEIRLLARTIAALGEEAER